MLKTQVEPLNSTTIPSKIQSFVDALENVIVIKDGHVIHSTLSDAFKAISIQSYDEANQAFLKEHRSNFTSDREVVNYNYDNINGSLLIHVPKKIMIKEKIHVFYVQEHIDVVQNVSIKLEEGAQLDYFEYLVNVNPGSVNFLSTTEVSKHAQLNYTVLANFDKQVAVSMNRIARVKENANLYYTNATFGDALTDQDTSVYLDEPYARAEAKTIALTNEAQEAIIKTLVEHDAPDTEGLIEHYGVVNDQSFLVFEGIGKINKGMKRSNARQSNKGVVLSKQARIDANPLLLIDEYDVVASHGAAIGRIDEEQLYYLMSRGLTRKAAEKLIINGYLAPLKGILSSEILDDHVNELLTKKTL